MKNETEKLFTAVRELARRDYNSWQFPFEDAFRAVDEFLASAASECQKAMYLLLNLTPQVKNDYVIVPAENVLVRNVYDGSQSEYEYAIDVAVYGGHQDHPVKLAILCDELPFNVRNRVLELRRRDVNLQAAGWLVLRFQSFEIIDELRSITERGVLGSKLEEVVDWIMGRQMKLINPDFWSNPELYKRLTGWDIKSNNTD